MDGVTDFNELGVCSINEEIKSKKRDKVCDKMEEIIDKYKKMANDEFDSYLKENGLDRAMGVVFDRKRHPELCE